MTAWGAFFSTGQGVALRTPGQKLENLGWKKAAYLAPHKAASSWGRNCTENTCPKAAEYEINTFPPEFGAGQPFPAHFDTFLDHFCTPPKRKCITVH